MTTVPVTFRIEPSDLERLQSLVNQLVVDVERLNAENDALTAERDSLLESEVVAERDAALADVAAVTAENQLLISEIAAIEVKVASAIATLS